jgi:hypothetical protein
MWCDNTQLSTSELKDTMRNYALERFLNDFLSALYLQRQQQSRDGNIPYTVMLQLVLSF